MSTVQFIRGGRSNSLNTVRLLACIQVLLGHLQAHLNLSLPILCETVINIFYGVPVFFILSGYLIFMSLAKSHDWNLYFNKRILRLYPELWICVFFELISIALFYNSHVPLIDYLKFAFTQGTLFQFWTPDSLRGYGCGTPNGSLWTITVIVQFYILIWLLFKFLNKAGIKTWIAVMLGAICWDVVIVPIIYSNVSEIVSKLIGVTVLNYLWLFLIGCFIARFKDKLLDYLQKYWWVFFLLLLFFLHSSLDIWGTMYPVLRSIFLGLFIIGAAYKFPQFNVKVDLSYGVYIWHMIFVNIAIALGYTSNWTAFAVCVLLSFSAAYLSYLSVGALSRKKKRNLIKS